MKAHMFLHVKNLDICPYASTVQYWAPHGFDDQMQVLLPPFESASTQMYTALAASVTQYAQPCRQRHRRRPMQSAHAATCGSSFDNGSDGGLEAINEQAEDEETGNGMSVTEDSALLPYAQRS